MVTLKSKCSHGVVTYDGDWNVQTFLSVLWSEVQFTKFAKVRVLPVFNVIMTSTGVHIYS